jgi:hypothetical protein
LSPERNILLYYVTAPDCPYCHEWDRKFRDALDASPERARLRLAILHSPGIAFTAYADSTWPNNIRWIRAALQKPGIQGRLPLYRVGPQKLLRRRYDWRISCISLWLED